MRTPADRPALHPHHPTALRRPALYALLVALAPGLAGGGVAGAPPAAQPPPHPGPEPSGAAAAPQGPAATAPEPQAAPRAGDDSANGAYESRPIVIRRSRDRAETAKAEHWIGALREQLVPVLRALAAVETARDRRPDEMVGVCRRLEAAVEAVDRGRLTPAPGLAPGLYVERALHELGLGARACLDGSFARTANHLHRAHALLGQLELALHRYRADAPGPDR